MNPPHARFSLRRYDGSSRRHAHEHHQLVIPLKGGLEVKVSGYADVVEGNRMAAIPARQPHTFSGAPPDRFLVMDVARGDNRRQNRLWEAAGDDPFVPMAGELGSLIQFISAHLARRGLDGVRADVMADLVLEALSGSSGHEPHGHRALALAVDHISAHLDQPLSVPAIARAASVSSARLHAIFATELGTAPMRYVARLRIDQARRLLEEHTTSISEIAQRTGYADQSAFTRAFRRATGQTPRQCRRQAR